ncbi:hypothetical protein QA641_16580 [Bradyrhizobium sp. CB1650]|uniref:hypothetical protein n=1 Tax=Bradyrhizobium sp. CB1650 TaxID=3039153 RepID=UPI0024347F1F|nr:hypothetical protein [Bradyrhizobium sp. CB1650]WGD55343.1 hypothetical protein QA641_16580 [Bradyrhizobium sp. CB1650]
MRHGRGQKIVHEAVFVLSNISAVPAPRPADKSPISQSNAHRIHLGCGQRGAIEATYCAGAPSSSLSTSGNTCRYSPCSRRPEMEDGELCRSTRAEDSRRWSFFHRRVAEGVWSVLYNDMSPLVNLGGTSSEKHLMKSIFLVNPVSGRGHLDSYARLYARALLELGYRVVLVAAADGDTSAYLARNDAKLRAAFSFVSFQDARSVALPEPRAAEELTTQEEPVSERCTMNVMRRARLVWQEEGAFGVLKRCVSVPRRVLMRLMPLSIRPQIHRIERAIARRLLKTPLACWMHPDLGRLLFSPLLEHVEKAPFIPGVPAPDLIFFLYLDLMAQHEQHVAALDRPGAPPWIGILFHPRLAKDKTAKIEGYLESRTARGGVFLVPAAVPLYAQTTPQLHFALAPDVGDLELPDEPSALAREMRKRAGNRAIVLQIGSITGHKGIPTLLDVIAAADPTRFFFALVGEVFWEHFGGDKARIRSFYARPPENVLLSQGYIKNERDYNDVIAAADIVYAVYRGFDSSSNSLTKAAGLRRPILVSGNTLMGNRVRRANIGAVATEGDAADILKQLCRLAEQPKDSFGFAAYEDEHSLEALKGVLADALPSWLGHPSS